MRATVAAHRAGAAASAGEPDASTIGQYIARFRANPPAQRGDREPANPADFWWLGPAASAGASDPAALSPSSPPPLASADASLGVSGGVGKLRRRSNPQHFEPYGRRERPRSLSRSSGGIAGFGPDESAEEEAELHTATANSDEFELVHEEVDEKPFRPRFVEPASAAAGAPENDASAEKEDILAQWRSRRRLQLAREAAADSQSPLMAAAADADQSLFKRPLNDVANHLSERLHAAEIEQRLRLRLARLGQQACTADRWAQTDDWAEGGFKSAAVQTDWPDVRHRDIQAADCELSSSLQRRSKSTQTPPPPPPTSSVIRRDEESRVTSLSGSYESLTGGLARLSVAQAAAGDAAEGDDEGGVDDGDATLADLLDRRGRLLRQLQLVDEALAARRAC